MCNLEGSTMSDDKRGWLERRFSDEEIKALFLIPMRIRLLDWMVSPPFFFHDFGIYKVIFGQGF